MTTINQSFPVGVIGAGSFGTAITMLLSHNNNEVLLYSRQKEQVESINAQKPHLGITFPKQVEATHSLENIAERCQLIFPIVPSANFRALMQNLGPLLRPYHMLIHGTKGLDSPEMDLINYATTTTITRKEVHTMSEIIEQESVVRRVGCLSGPNLANEIIDGQPTATVIASRFDEVINAGRKALRSQHFHVFGTNEILGAELAGAFKNIIAIGTGILWGYGFGKNIQAILINRGLMEIISFGQKMGATTEAFYGTAGMADLVATATSKDSRNFTFGYRLGKGEDRVKIAETMPELAEGVRTLYIARQLADDYKLSVPIIDMLYRIVFENYDVQKAIHYLMVYPYRMDVSI